MLPNQLKSRKSPIFRHDPRFYALMNFSVPSADRFFLSSKVTTYNPGRKLKGGGSLRCLHPTFDMFLMLKNENTSREALGIYVETLLLLDFMTKIAPAKPFFFQEITFFDIVDCHL